MRTRAGPIVVALLLPVLALGVMGCGLTVEQRKDIVDTLTTELSERIGEQVEKRTEEGIERVTAKVTERLEEKADEYGLTQEEIEGFADTMRTVAKEEVKQFTEEKLPVIVREGVERVVPEPIDEGKKDTAGKTIGSILYGLLSVGLGIARRGGGAPA